MRRIALPEHRSIPAKSGRCSTQTCWNPANAAWCSAQAQAPLRPIPAGVRRCWSNEPFGRSRQGRSSAAPSFTPASSGPSSAPLWPMPAPTLVDVGRSWPTFLAQPTSTQIQPTPTTFGRNSAEHRPNLLEVGQTWPHLGRKNKAEVSRALLFLSLPWGPAGTRARAVAPGSVHCATSNMLPECRHIPPFCVYPT